MNKGKTIGELIDEARIKSREPTLAGHDIMTLERFADSTQHMITFEVLSYSSPVGNKGGRMRLFLSENGYQKALESQQRGEIKMLKHAKVFKGDIFFMTSQTVNQMILPQYYAVAIFIPK